MARRSRATASAATRPRTPGGAIKAVDAFTSDHNVYMGNRAADDGGALWSIGELTSLHDDFIANETDGSGQAIALFGGDFAVSHSLFVHHPGDARVVDDVFSSGSELMYLLSHENAGPLTSGPTGEGTRRRRPAVHRARSRRLRGQRPHPCSPTAPRLDAGDPATPDDDGSPADIGAFGPEPPPGETTGDDGQGGSQGDSQGDDQRNNPHRRRVGDPADRGVRLRVRAARLGRGVRGVRSPSRGLVSRRR